jgi:hypothetical protein
VTFFVDTASGMPPVCGCSFWSGIFNNVTGIGLGRSTVDPDGEPPDCRVPLPQSGPLPIWRYVMLQEFCHQFAAFTRYSDPSPAPR